MANQKTIKPTEATVKQAYANLVLRYAEHAPVAMLARKNPKLLAATYLLINLVREDEDYNYWREDLWDAELSDLEGFLNELSCDAELMALVDSKASFYVLPWRTMEEHDEMIKLIQERARKYITAWSYRLGDVSELQGVRQQIALQKRLNRDGKALSQKLTAEDRVQRRINQILYGKDQ
ncbi:hypothetical protein [Limosilactobacillus mucosae]|uniref:Uncharacterized protein n=1 Tax=Limosilactobacillus mucosae TaxID=97478 RepID=A0AAJ1HQP7_LIMMU|nr:hypothetical protein [Limosilactobacillus mucosae]MDC2828949.1 hypothetical protein [Limosilactobacillus mucosae]